MAEVTIRHQFYNWVDDEGVPGFARQGETVDLPDEEVERGNALGAFEDSPPPATDEMTAAFGEGVEADPESGVPHDRPPEVSEEAAEFPEPEEEDEEPDVPDPTGEAYPELADEDDSGNVPKQQPALNTPDEPAERRRTWPAGQSQGSAKRAAKRSPKAQAKTDKALRQERQESKPAAKPAPGSQS